MTQVEFEQKLKELKAQKNAELQPLQMIMDDLDVRRTAKRQVLKSIEEQYQQIMTERSIIARRINDLRTEWNKRINDFQRENYSEERNLEDVSVWALVKELNKRGYSGNLQNSELSDEHNETLNKWLHCNVYEEQQTTKPLNN